MKAKLGASTPFSCELPPERLGAIRFRAYLKFDRRLARDNCALLLLAGNQVAGPRVQLVQPLQTLRCCWRQHTLAQ